MTMSIVERVARIISVYSMDDPDDMTNAYPGGPLYPLWKEYEAAAKDILSAIREPTDAMVAAGGNAQTVTARAKRRGSFQAMIDKALESEA